MTAASADRGGDITGAVTRQQAAPAVQILLYKEGTPDEATTRAARRLARRRSDIGA